MTAAAWGVYSLRGRGASHPVAVTADNFLRTLPFAALLLLHEGFEATSSMAVHEQVVFARSLPAALGQRDPEVTSGLARRLRLERATLGLDRPARDREPEPGA